MLAFDYGYTIKENQNTLQSIEKHKYSDIFFKPGHSDITSLINFKLFRKLLCKNKLNVEKITKQTEFLKKNGYFGKSKYFSYQNDI